jgi:hypothetical protein
MKDATILFGRPLRFMHRSVYFIAAFLALGAPQYRLKRSGKGVALLAGRTYVVDDFSPL